MDINTQYEKNYTLQKRLDEEFGLVGDFVGIGVMIGFFAVLAFPVPVWFVLAYICSLLILIVLGYLPSIIRLFWTKEQREGYEWYVQREKERKW